MVAEVSPSSGNTFKWVRIRKAAEATGYTETNINNVAWVPLSQESIMKFIAALIFTCISATALADDTPARLDPNALQQQSWQFYTRELDGSLGVGSCIVRLTVTAAGRSRGESIETSSTLRKLDLSCLKWVHYFCWLPATHDGQAVESSTRVQIDWTPMSSDPPVLGRVAGVPREIFKPKPGTKTCIPPSEFGRAWTP